MAELFVVEIPLLFETGRGGDFDFTVAVTVPEERRRLWAESEAWTRRRCGPWRRRQLGERRPGGPA